MEETEEEELESKSNANNVTRYYFCQSPFMTISQGKIANVPNERWIYSNILAERIKGFKWLTLDSTINDYAYYHSEKDDVESNPNSDPKLATHISDKKKKSHW